MSCVCGNVRAYADCCGPLHAGGVAVSAEALMRSRYSAYVRGDIDYLLNTWHGSTRPPRESLSPEPGTRWLGLEVKRATEADDNATVQFIARFKVGGAPAVRLNEVSRFVREQGRWHYVDGVLE